MVTLKNTKEPHPFNVIVPFYNAESYIMRFLNFMDFSIRELRRNHPEAEFEVIFIDNNSNDHSLSLLLSAIEKSNLKKFYRVISCKKQGSYAARNAGLKVASGDFVAFTDIDCMVGEAWLLMLYQHFKSGERAICAGSVIMIPDSSNYLSEALSMYDQVRFLNQELNVENGCAVTANMCVRRSVFNSVGVFSGVESGGDIEFSKRVTKRGHKIDYVRDIEVRHDCRATFKELGNKVNRVARGSSEKKLSQVCKDSICLFFFIDAFIFYKRFFFEKKISKSSRFSIVAFIFLMPIVFFFGAFFRGSRIHESISNI